MALPPRRRQWLAAARGAAMAAGVGLLFPAEAGAWNGILSAADESKVELAATIGNGFVASVMDSKQDANVAYIAGVFNDPDAAHQDGKTGPISHRAAVPAPLKYGPSGAVAGDAGAELDLQRGIYVRRTKLVGGGAPDGAVLHQRIYAHRKRRFLMTMEYEATWEGGPEKFALEFDRPEITEEAFPDFDVLPLGESEGESVRVRGEEVPLLLWRGKTKVAETGAELTEVALAAFAPKRVEVQRGKRHGMLAAYRTSLDCPPPAQCQSPMQEAISALRSVIDEGGADGDESLFEEHVAEWADLWKSGFSVEGRLDVEQAVKASTYYILSSLREDRPFSLSPGGLASNSYNGHTFWDTETWMYPPLLVWHPELARSLLDYRVDRVPAARRKAESYSNEHFRGAMFPWESAFMGVEVCPTWAPFGLLEQHISADIVFAVRQYFHLTGDKDWLRSVMPMIEDIAEFYISKAKEAQVPGRYHINDVIPPDEFNEEGVDDSVYMNFVVKLALEFADQAARLLGEAAKPEWKKVADGLVVLYDDELHRHPEYLDYRWGKTIKQADVVLLRYPLGLDESDETQRQDLDYYAKVTDPGGPAMTWGMHAIGFLGLGEDDKAAANFNRSFANVKQPFLVWTETPTGGATNFITGAGGFLQVVIFGFFGIRIQDGAIDLAPRLMEGATSQELRGVHFLGRSITVTCSTKAIHLSLVEGEPLSVRVGNESKTVRLGSDKQLSFPSGSKVTLALPGADDAEETQEKLEARGMGMRGAGLPAAFRPAPRSPFLASAYAVAAAAALAAAVASVGFRRLAPRVWSPMPGACDGAASDETGVRLLD